MEQHNHQNNNELTTCPECLGKIVIANGAYVCSQCGLVIEQEYKDPLPFSFDDTTKAPKKTLHSLATTHDGINGYGSKIFMNNSRPSLKNLSTLSPETIRKFYRLSKYYQDPSLIDNSQAMLRAIKIFREVALYLQISQDLKERTINIFKNLARENKGHITNHTTLIAASFLFAIKESGNKTTLRIKEAINAFSALGYRVSSKAVSRLIFELKQKPKLKKTQRSSFDYLPRIINNVMNPDVKRRVQNNYGLEFNEYILLLIKLTKKILHTIPFKMKGGVNPFNFAVSCTYFADREIARFLHKKAVFTQKYLSALTSVPEYTIRDHSHKIIHKALPLLRSQTLPLLQHEYKKIPKNKKMEPQAGIEPTTSCLPSKRSAV